MDTRSPESQENDLPKSGFQILAHKVRTEWEKIQLQNDGHVISADYQKLIDTITTTSSLPVSNYVDAAQAVQTPSSSEYNQLQEDAQQVLWYRALETAMIGIRNAEDELGDRSYLLTDEDKQDITQEIYIWFLKQLKSDDYIKRLASNEKAGDIQYELYRRLVDRAHRQAVIRVVNKSRTRRNFPEIAISELKDKRDLEEVKQSEALNYPSEDEIRRISENIAIFDDLLEESGCTEREKLLLTLYYRYNFLPHEMVNYLPKYDSYGKIIENEQLREGAIDVLRRRALNKLRRTAIQKGYKLPEY